MKILLISYFFPPTNVMGAVRTGKLAKYLHSKGHDVRVLTANEKFLPKELELDIPKSLVSYTPTIDLDRLPIWVMNLFIDNPAQAASRQSSVFSRAGRIYKSLFTVPDGQVAWVPLAIQEGKRITADWKPDVIYASAMPLSCFFVARSLSRRLGVPWIGEFRDLWADGHYYSLPKWRRSLDDKIERWATKTAHSLVTVSESMADLLSEKYGKEVVTVLNGFDAADAQNATPKPLSKASDLAILYTGLIYDRKRDPSPLFSAISRLGEERDRVTVYFYGRLLGAVDELAKSFGVFDRVVARDPVSHKEALNLQAGADALLLLLWDHRDEKGIFPGKFFEYLGARRPILMIGPRDSVTADLITERGAGEVASDPDEIANTLRNWLEAKRNGELKRLPMNIGERYSREAQFSLLDPLLAKCAEESAQKVKSIRVLHVISGLHTGGAERSLAAFSAYQAERNVDVRVVALTSGGELVGQIENAGIKVTCLNFRRPLDIPRAMMKLRRIIRDFRPTHVQGWMYHADMVSTIALYMSGLRNQCKLYWGIRCSNMDLSRYSLQLGAVVRICRLLSHLPDKILANSKSGLDYHMGFGYRPKQQVIVANGVNTDVFKPDSSARARVRTELNLPQDAVLVIAAARNDPMKGYDKFVDAIESIPDIRAVIVGRETEVFGRNPKILALGERRDVQNMMAAADIFVSSSIYGEGSSNTILEAMASGLPVIATDVGDAQRLVGDTGRIVPPNDATAIADAIRELIALTPEQRKKIGKAARKRAVEKYRTSVSFERQNREYELAV